MLPRYIAFKKSTLNYYSVFENVPSNNVKGAQCIKLVPKMTKDLNINRLEYRVYDINIQAHKCYLRRSTRSSPFYKDHMFNLSYTGYEFMMVHDYETYYVPVLQTPDEKLLGERWNGSHSDYMFAFEGGSDEIQKIKDSLSEENRTTIVNYDMTGGRTLVRLVDRKQLPDYVIKGWLKNAVQTETCPISHDSMTLDDICSTPCYHVMTYSAAFRWISDSKSCPVCRKSCVIGSLIRP
jgi:hypothetical protein